MSTYLVGGVSDVHLSCWRCQWCPPTLLEVAVRPRPLSLCIAKAVATHDVIVSGAFTSSVVSPSSLHSSCKVNNNNNINNVFILFLVYCCLETIQEVLLLKM